MIMMILKILKIVDNEYQNKDKLYFVNMMLNYLQFWEKFFEVFSIKKHEFY